MTDEPTDEHKAVPAKWRKQRGNPFVTPCLAREPERLDQRARIVLLASQGVSNSEIARRRGDRDRR